MPKAMGEPDLISRQGQAKIFPFLAPSRLIWGPPNLQWVAGVHSVVKKAAGPDNVHLFFVEQGLLKYRELTEETFEQLPLGQDFLVSKNAGSLVN